MKFTFTRKHVIALLVVAISIWLIVNHMPKPMGLKLGNLTKSQLQNAIVNRSIVEASTGSPDRYYTIQYNADGTFLVNYLNNNQKIGSIKGVYEVISKMGKGYINIHSKEANIPDGEHHVGVLNPKHPNSISDGKDHKWTDGPYKLLNNVNNLTVLSYHSSRGNNDRIMNVYH
jgi:hypothetical protein